MRIFFQRICCKDIRNIRLVRQFLYKIEYRKSVTNNSAFDFIKEKNEKNARQSSNLYSQKRMQ